MKNVKGENLLIKTKKSKANDRNICGNMIEQSLLTNNKYEYKCSTFSN